MTLQTTALLYLRTACTDDASIAQQRQDCTDYANTRGWRVLDTIVDNGVSGMGGVSRLDALQDRVASGEAQAIITADLSRISRDPVQVRAFVQLCQQHGVDLCIVKEPFSIDDVLKFVDIVQSAPTDNQRTAGEDSL
ncbi:recombinase family protein [Loktanella sp. SALINAS62]|uniref:recombinase family protein n=1 Tax=Loktanella sp. SALINAS62 TaxID=2706124 RepID=UPI001B8A98C4|nr:recombinase family protein [Loktanella sp. SALINAS62]MBS1302519.1 recombinase family protein [Loktanella sp. SALINAS62]